MVGVRSVDHNKRLVCHKKYEVDGLQKINLKVSDELYAPHRHSPLLVYSLLAWCPAAKAVSDLESKSCTLMFRFKLSQTLTIVFTFVFRLRFMFMPTLNFMFTVTFASEVYVYESDSTGIENTIRLVLERLFLVCDAITPHNTSFCNDSMRCHDIGPVAMTNTLCEHSIQPPGGM